jgi:hypothetical protein
VCCCGSLQLLQIARAINFSTMRVSYCSRQDTVCTEHA